jgi:hypothetical protein
MILDVRVPQARVQRFLPELRHPARARDAPHVRQQFDAILAQQRDELLDGAGGMADGVEGAGHGGRYSTVNGRRSTIND